jgi:tetratricopeptide (TPR) repeat protein
MEPDGPELGAVVTARMAAAGRGLRPGNRAWAEAMDGLAESLLDEAVSAHTDGVPGEPGEFDAAVLVRRRAISSLDAELRASTGADLRHNLGVDLTNRYRLGGGLRDLQDACELAREVLADASPAGQLIAAATLAGRLGLLARVPGHEAELGRAIRILSDTLERSADDDPARPIAVTSLAGLQTQRWRRDGDLAALDAAAAALQAELRRGHITGATPTAVNAAGLLLDYSEQTHDLALFRQAEDLLRAIAEHGSPEEVIAARGTLAIALVTRFDLTGGEDLLTEAVTLASDAITARRPGPERAEDLSTRAAARAALGRQRGDRELLDAAIGDARAAAAEPAIHPADASGPANSLAMLLAERYDLFGDSGDLDESIAIYDDFLRQDGQAADARPALRVNLANGLLSRFERDRSDRDRAIRDRAVTGLRRAARLADEAIGETPPDSVHLAARHDTAGRVRAALAYHLGAPGDAGRAEEHARRAAGATPQGSPDRAHYLNNWAMWVTDRWERTSDPAALASAIGLLDQALEAAQGDGQLRATISFNLGVRTQERFELGLERGDADWDDLQRACDLLDEVLAAELPHLTLPAGKRLGDIAMRLSMWPEAEHALRLALAAAGELSGLRSRQPDKQRARSGVQGIGALAALSAVRAGDPAAAALHLEQASATLLAESLGIRGDSVRFADITAGCRSMGRSILYLGCSPAGGLGVLAGPESGCRAVELPALTEEAVNAAVTEFRAALATALTADPDQDQDAGGEAGADDPLGACYAAGGRLLDWTWSSVLAPLRDLLAGTGRLAVLPLGRLAWLPLAAAGPRQMAPALATHEPVLLIRATAASPGTGPADEPAREARDAAAVPADVPRVLVWADTGPADRAIPGVLDEAQRIAAIHPGARLRLRDRLHPGHNGQPSDAPVQAAPLRSSLGSGTGSAAAPSGRRAAAEAVTLLRSADLVHLACHCDVVPAHPEDTMLQVDPPVRVGDMGTGGLRARTHIVLSACDAALTATSLPDEALSPATALLLAGAGTVTAPVWPVDDEATAEFMTAYHRELATGTAPGRALSSVQATWSASRPAFLYAPWVVVVRPQGTAA